MRSIEKILVCFKPNSSNVALQRAEQIALALGARLDLLLLDAQLDQREFLDCQLRSLRERGLHADGEQAWVDEKHASNKILETARQLGSDLLVKQHHPDTWLQKLLLPDDWHLSREAPVPLLLVQEKRSWSASCVLAAMDVEHQDSAHLALQGNVIGYASALSEIFAARLHVVSAFAPFASNFSEFDRAVAGHLVLNQDAAHKSKQNGVGGWSSSAYGRHCHDMCQWFQEEYELSDQQLHIAEGPAKQVIPNVASQLDASLVVLGTVARHGLLGALVGNTVEAVLDKLQCDVLVLHPHIDSAQRPAQMEQWAS